MPDMKEADLYSPVDSYVTSFEFIILLYLSLEVLNILQVTYR